MDALVLFAKFPESGRVKKKIGTIIGMDFSANLCKCFIDDLIAKNKDRNYDLYLSFIGPEYKDKYHAMFPSAILYVQRGTNLSENMKYAFTDLLDNYSKVVIIGCDVPNLDSEIVEKAYNALSSYDVVLGPAEDGGYYLIGMKAQNDVFEDLPWGTEKLLEVQMKKLIDHKLTFAMLERLPDVDTIDELRCLKKTLKKEDAPQTYEFVQGLDV
jgi:rSAM/selenodomain-associated transferase 1